MTVHIQQEGHISVALMEIIQSQLDVALSDVAMWSLRASNEISFYEKLPFGCILWIS
jgi:hypothetical protein